jgi:sucrose-phosphate synthase
MQFEKEEACRLSKRQPETEKTRADATADMSEDLFEGEKGEDAGDPSVAYGDSTTGSSPKTSSIDKLYIVLIRYRGYSFQIIFKYGAWKKCFFYFSCRHLKGH